MLKLFQKRFYILMFLVWLLAVGFIFMLTAGSEISRYLTDTNSPFMRKEAVVTTFIEPILLVES